MLRTKQRLALVAGILASSCVAVGIAYAAGGIPGADGVIQGCYDSGGNVKVVAALPCPARYTSLPWNQAGTKGDRGDKGDQGLPGLPGKNGVDGKDGAPGAKGDKGDPCLPSDPACVGPKGDTGAQGPPGPPGQDGDPGQPGADGVSVMSAVEPDGTNCPNGGSKFTSLTGITYACNGADGTGGGPTGQNAVTAYGTGSLTTTAFLFSDVPGLLTTVNVPANSVLYISTDGGVSMANAATSASSSVVVDIALVIDGNGVPHGGFRRVYALDNAAVWQGPVESWSLAVTAPLTPGNHTIKVQARLAGSVNAPGGAIVSGGDGTVTQGTLNVITIAQ